jgi:hypothetical protein
VCLAKYADLLRTVWDGVDLRLGAESEWCCVRSAEPPKALLEEGYPCVVERAMREFLNVASPVQGKDANEFLDHLLKELSSSMRDVFRRLFGVAGGCRCDHLLVSGSLLGANAGVLVWTTTGWRSSFAMVNVI